MKLSDEIMYEASIKKDPNFLGVYWLAVKTTGIFCLPTCTERKPKRENVEFFLSQKLALENGYRPCKICKPLENSASAPAEIQNLINEITENSDLKLKDADLIIRNLSPATVRRWFLKHYGITFQAYQRQLKLNKAFKKIHEGENILQVASESGFESLSGFNESFKNLFKNSPKNSGQEKIIDLKRIETPLGVMYAAANHAGIVMLEFADRKSLESELVDLAKAFNAKILIGDNFHLQLLEKELKQYFNKELKHFTVSIAPVGTEFQKSVWKILKEIPYGQTWTYKKQAEALGDVKKVRAVANANGLNKISIVLPCHRVIGSNGKLTGYGGGVWRKHKLLELEKENF